jgi:hypothetical protein
MANRTHQRPRKLGGGLVTELGIEMVSESGDCMINFGTNNPKPVQVQHCRHKISQAANGIEPNPSNGECSGRIIVNFVFPIENREPGLRVVLGKNSRKATHYKRTPLLE